ILILVHRRIAGMHNKKYLLLPEEPYIEVRDLECHSVRVIVLDPVATQNRRASRSAGQAERPAQGGKENINFLYSLGVVRLLRQLRGITGLFRREYKIPCRLQIALAVRRVDRHSWVADMAQTPIYYLGNHRGNVMEPIYQTGVRDIAVDRWDKSEEYIV